MEALFAYLISHDLLSPDLLSRAERALAPRKLRNSTLRKRLRRSPAPARDLARSVLACVRGGQSDEDLWITWRWAIHDPGTTVWLKDLDFRPELNGTLAFMAEFDSDVSRIRVKLSSGETLLLPGRNLSWGPPDPADVDAVSLLLSKVIDLETAGKVCALLGCTRCERRCESDTQCVVPHSFFKRLELVGEGGPLGDRIYYLCFACGELLWKDGGATAVKSVRNCWEGNHTTVKLVSQDRRVSTWHHATLIMHDHMQQEIAEIPDTTPSLLFRGEFGPFGYQFKEDDFEFLDYLEDRQVAQRINNGDFGPFGYQFEDEDFGFIDYMEEKQMALRIKIDRSLPNLKLLHFRSHRTAELVVSDELMPELRILCLESMPTFVTYNISSSSLKILRVQVWFGLESVIEAIIQGAKALEEFQATYVAFRELLIASNSLKVVHLSKGNGRMESLSMWTPNLEVLVVRSIHIEELCWLENHPLETNLPPGHVRPALRVRTEKSNVNEGWLDQPNFSYFDGPIYLEEDLPAVHRSKLLERFGLEKYGARSSPFAVKNYGGFA